MKLRITSLNMQGFEDWDTRVSSILGYLREQAPQIICFQEVVFLPEIAPVSPVALLNNVLNYPFESIDISRLQKGIEYPVYREGLATISQLPIMRSESVILQQAIQDPLNRIIQLVDIMVDSTTTVKLANVHFSVTDSFDFATTHLEETLHIIKARNEKRIIIGDFNLSSLDHVKHLWGEDYTATSEAYDYISFPGENKCIDYALVPKEYTIESLEISPDNLSDHRAISVLLSIPDTI